MLPERNVTLRGWLSITLRWLVLLGLGLSVANGQTQPANALILLAAALWNLALSALLLLEQPRTLNRFIIVLGDVLIAAVLFYFSDGYTARGGWTGILPVFSAAIYFEVAGGLFTSMLILLYQLGITWLTDNSLASLLNTAVMLPVFLIAGTLIGIFSARMNTTTKRLPRAEEKPRSDPGLLEAERRGMIYKVVSELSATLNYPRVLAAALDLSTQALAPTAGNGERLVSAVLLYEKDQAGQPTLHVVQARHFTSHDQRVTLPGVQGALGRCIEEGRAMPAEDPARDAELSRFVAVRGCASTYCLPLRSGLETNGVLLYAHPDAGYFTRERCEMLDIIANQAMIAIQNARLYRDLEMEKEKVIETQEEARKKLARDLHDGPTQSVAALAMRVNYARRLMERDPHAAADELFKTEELARRITKEIRHMLFTLRPLTLESEGLVAALESMAEKNRETYNQQVVIEADDGVAAEIENNKAGVLFAIAEEATTNARKHAKAQHIWVRLKEIESDIAMLEIEDNGVGFDSKQVNAGYEGRGSLGMVNMRERTELVNGVLHIDTAVGHGTRIQVVIPLSEEAVERIRRGL